MAFENRSRFLIRNLGRGLLYLGLLIVIFVLVKKYVPNDQYDWLKPIYDKPSLVYIVYTLSEILFGIIPPEIFMMWAARFGDTSAYIWNVASFSTISYAAGFIGFWVGKHLHYTKFYRWVRFRFLGKYEKYINEYGAFIVIVAAATPLPYSGISMLVGAVNYSRTRYLLFGLVRFLRFGVYAYFIWQADKI